MIVLYWSPSDVSDQNQCKISSRQEGRTLWYLTDSQVPEKVGEPQTQSHQELSFHLSPLLPVFAPLN